MNKISIIYAFRDRDADRVRLSMESLRKQEEQNFEVVFVDYGSKHNISEEVKKVLKEFQFCNYFYLEALHRLWNKSRALNYGIKQSKHPHIFIADVDLIFSPEATSFLEKKSSEKSFHLFRMGYLGEKLSKELRKEQDFRNLRPDRTGEVNGMVLARKEAFYEVKGYDEFYHFYGAEDVDLYARLSTAGYKEEKTEGIHFYHNWHSSYQSSDLQELSSTPRLRNAMRINEQHYFSTLNNKVIVPFSQATWGETFDSSEIEKLNSPQHTIELENIAAEVEHFFNEGIKSYENKIIEIRVKESGYYRSAKYRLKKIALKQSQIYISMKEVNDIILKKIIFDFRDRNYSYTISPSLKTITFKIEL